MSFQQGVSGVVAAGRNLDVIGNNVANASTIGAKSSRAEFADIYAQASGSGTSVGIGVSVSTVAQQFGQGSISSTSSALDVAINGNGFFQLADRNGMIQYGRNGQFQLDREGSIVNAQGLKLLGHPIDPSTGLDPGLAMPLQVPTVGIPPTPSSRVSLEINVSAKSDIIDSATLPIDFNDNRTYNNSTALTCYDAKGQSVAITYFFQKSAIDTWNVYAAANGEPLNPDGAGKPQPIETINFKADGSGPITPISPSVVNVPATGLGTSIVTEPLVGMTVDLTKLTQFASPFGPTNLTQNGSAPGKLSAVTVQQDGIVMASYSSGQSAPIGMIELASFRNQQGLKPMGGNTWAASFSSGEPVMGTPGSGNRGTLQASSLEESNIDLTNELVNMMVAQRIYQANAQTIKTQDQVMQTLVNLR